MTKSLERRNGTPNSPSTPLPADYLKMVAEVFSANFDDGLKKLQKIKKAKARFETSGKVFSEELILSVSLVHEDVLSATTVHASMDFDPRASSPTIQDLLSHCVDGIGTLFGQLLSGSQERLEQLADESLAVFENIPFKWTAVEIDKRKIYLKVDKTNPRLDQLADEWLSKNDPDLKELEEETEREVEKLFVTGPKKGAKLH